MHSTVKQILAMQPGEVVQGFTGRVKKVFDQKAGTSDRGRDWKKQGVVIADGNFEIQLSIWNQSQLKSQQWEGRIIEIWQDGGMKVGDYTPRNGGKTVRQLEVNEEATISEGNGAPAAAPTAPPARPNAPAAPAPSVGGYDAAKTAAHQASALMILAGKAAIHAGKAIEAESKVIVSPETLSQLTSDIFGALERAGHLGNMPGGAKVAPKPAPPAAPAAPQPAANPTCKECGNETTGGICTTENCPAFEVPF